MVLFERVMTAACLYLLRKHAFLCFLYEGRLEYPSVLGVLEYHCALFKLVYALQILKIGILHSTSYLIMWLLLLERVNSHVPLTSRAAS